MKISTVWSRVSMLFLSLCVSLVSVGCSDDTEGVDGAADADSGLRERDLSADDRGADDSDSNDGGDTEQSDAVNQDGEDGQQDSGGDNDAAGPDTDGGNDDQGQDEDAAAPGPDNPTIECLTDNDCPAVGEEEGICCSTDAGYRSYCAAESACSGGLHDACLVPEQCQARRPGQWTVCCHDRLEGGAANYCAPILETCQPLVLCDVVSDCAGEGTTCCSYHTFYQTNTCTSEFFALNPDTDCQ